MSKATAGERLAAKFYGWTIREVKSSPNTLAKCVDHILDIERAKVAEDVLAMAYPATVELTGTERAKVLKNLSQAIRAKYGKE